MAEFILVRSKNGPPETYLAPAAAVRAFPDRYVVVAESPAVEVEAPAERVRVRKSGGKTKKEENDA